MKTILFFRSCFSMLVFVLISGSVYTQVEEQNLTREEQQLMRAQDKVKRAEASVARAQAGLNEADSLIATGGQMMDNAKVNLKQLKAERATLIKVYNAEKKDLERQLKNADRMVRDKLRQEVRDKDARHREELRALDAKIKEADRNFNKGKSNISKGKEKQKAAGKRMKPAQKTLRDAQKDLEKLEAPVIDEQKEEKPDKPEKKKNEKSDEDSSDD